MRLSLLSLVLLTACPAVLLAQAEQADKPSKQDQIARHWLTISREYAESWTVAPQEADSKPYALFEKPVFQHTQSVRGDDIGAMHLWTRADSRPATIGVVFAWTNTPTSRMVSYEFHSLVPEPLTLREGDRLIWTSASPGFQWQEFPPGTQAPGANKLQQRIQARRMASQFEANTTTTKDERWELRLVPTPIYQYEAPEAGVSYGAIFVFCQGTDTEVMLLLEAHAELQAANAKAAWRYALLPFTDYKARVNYQEQPLWESPPGQLNENGKPHFWGFIGPSPKPEVELE